MDLLVDIAFFLVLIAIYTAVTAKAIDETASLWIPIAGFGGATLFAKFHYFYKGKNIYLSGGAVALGIALLLLTIILIVSFIST